MRKICFLICLVMSLSVTPLFAKEQQRYIIHFANGIDYSLLDGVDYELHHTFDFIDRIAISIDSETANKLEGHPMLSIEKDPDVTIEEQMIGYHHSFIQREDSYFLNVTGRGVKVAVLDTGIKKNHPDLNVRGGVNTINKTDNYGDDNGHGTHVAGIIAALDNDLGIKGISPNVELYAIKALDEHGEGTQTDIIAGIQWAIENDIDLINLSITTPVSTEALKSMLDYSYKQGIISVAASGNNHEASLNRQDSVMYPAKYPSVIAVGSINQRKERSNFSQTGTSLEFVAPGEQILSTFIDKDQPYAKLSGTSMATPVVTAVLSLYKEAYPSLSVNDIRLYAQKQSLDLGTPGRDDLYGYGLIQRPVSWFLDVDENSWYFYPVQALREQQLVLGFPGEFYQPNRSVTRAEFAAFIGRVLEADLSENDRLIFPDVKEESFAAPYITTLTSLGIINGYPDGTFRPNRAITRGEVAFIIDQAFSISGHTVRDYRDLNPSAFYFDAVKRLTQANIMHGYPDRTFKADSSMTRAEIASVLYQIVDKIRLAAA